MSVHQTSCAAFVYRHTEVEQAVFTSHPVLGFAFSAMSSEARGNTYATHEPAVLVHLN